MITGCWACPARSVAFKSKGFGEWECARNRFILFTGHYYEMDINRARLFLDDNYSGHLRMNGAKIVVSARSARCDCELLVGVERGRFLKLLLDAHDSVRFFIAVDPSHLCSRLHGYGLRIEGEIFDLYSILFSGGVVGVLHLASEGKERQVKKTDAAQQRRHFILRSKSNHSLSGFS